MHHISSARKLDGPSRWEVGTYCLNDNCLID